MKKLFFSLIAFATAVSVLAVAPGAARSQGYNDDDDYRYRYRRYRHYDRCHATIRATGVGYPFSGISRSSAIKAWRREAEAVYGRDFNWSNARDTYISCEPYKLVIRCTASARPCD